MRYGRVVILRPSAGQSNVLRINYAGLRLRTFETFAYLISGAEFARDDFPKSDVNYLHPGGFFKSTH